MKVKTQKGLPPTTFEQPPSVGGGAQPPVALPVATQESLAQAASPTGDKNVMPPLHKAAALADPRAVRRAIGHVTSIDERGPAGLTALHQAAKRGNAWTLAQLLLAGANPALRSDDGETALDMARASGSQAMQFVLKEAMGLQDEPPAENNARQVSPALPEPVRMREKIRDAIERSTMRRSSSFERAYRKVFATYETVHVPPPLDGHEAASFPAHAAAQRGELTTLQRLLDANPQLARARTPAGWTPMHHAVAANSVAMIESLVEHGASVGTSNLAGVPAWACAVMPEMFPFLATLPYWEVDQARHVKLDADTIIRYVKTKLAGQPIDARSISTALSDLTGIPLELVQQTTSPVATRKYVGNLLSLTGHFRDLRGIDGSLPLSVNLQNMRGLIEAMMKPRVVAQSLPADVYQRLREVLGGNDGIQSMLAEQLVLSLGDLTWEGIAVGRSFRTREFDDRFDSHDNIDPFLAQYAIARLDGLGDRQVMVMPIEVDDGGKHAVSLGVHRQHDSQGDRFVFLLHNAARGAQEHPVDPDTGNVQPVAFTVAVEALQTSPAALSRLLCALNLDQMPLQIMYAHLGVFLLSMERAVPGCVSFDGVGADVLYVKRPQRSGNCAVASRRFTAWVQLALNARERLGPSASVADVHQEASFTGRALRDFRANRLLPEIKRLKLLGFNPTVLRDNTNRIRIADLVRKALDVGRASQLDYDAEREPALAQLEHVLRQHGKLVPKLSASVLDDVIKRNDCGVMRRLLEYGAQPSPWTLWRYGTPRMRQLCG